MDLTGDDRSPLLRLSQRGMFVRELSTITQMDFMTDTRLVCEDGIVHGNALLLATWSDVFRTFMEDTVDSQGKFTCILPGVSSDTMKNVLNWSLHGRVVLTSPQVQEMTAALHLLGVTINFSQQLVLQQDRKSADKVLWIGNTEGDDQEQATDKSDESFDSAKKLAPANVGNEQMQLDHEVSEEAEDVKVVGEKISPSKEEMLMEDGCQLNLETKEEFEEKTPSNSAKGVIKINNGTNNEVYMIDELENKSSVKSSGLLPENEEDQSEEVVDQSSEVSDQNTIRESDDADVVKSPIEESKSENEQMEDNDDDENETKQESFDGENVDEKETGEETASTTTLISPKHDEDGTDIEDEDANDAEQETSEYEPHTTDESETEEVEEKAIECDEKKSASKSSEDEQMHCLVTQSNDVSIPENDVSSNEEDVASLKKEISDNENSQACKNKSSQHLSLQKTSVKLLRLDAHKMSRYFPNKSLPASRSNTLGKVTKSRQFSTTKQLSLANTRVSHDIASEWNQCLDYFKQLNMSCETCRFKKAKQPSSLIGHLAVKHCWNVLLHKFGNTGACNLCGKVCADWPKQQGRAVMHVAYMHPNFLLNALPKEAADYLRKFPTKFDSRKFREDKNDVSVKTSVLRATQSSHLQKMNGAVGNGNRRVNVGPGPSGRPCIRPPQQNAQLRKPLRNYSKKSRKGLPHPHIQTAQLNMQAMRQQLNNNNNRVKENIQAFEETQSVSSLNPADLLEVSMQVQESEVSLHDDFGRNLQKGSPSIPTQKRQSTSNVTKRPPRVSSLPTGAATTFCQHCCLTFRHLHDLRAHLCTTHYKPKLMLQFKIVSPRTCRLCSRSIPVDVRGDVGDAYNAMLIHVGVAHRGLDLVVPQSLKPMLQPATVDFRLSCQLCAGRLRFKTVAALRTHIAVTHFGDEILRRAGAAAGQAVCPECGVRCRPQHPSMQKSSLVVHLSTEHGYLDRVVHGSLKANLNRLQSLK